MSKKVTFNIIRDDNQSLVLDGEEWGIVGLENWANLSHELSVTENANYDGGIITNSRIASIDRTIEARLKDARLNELMRERILSFFNPKHEYEVHVEYQGMKRYCKGVQYGFSCDNGNVYQPITFSWTILCTQPYMLSEDDFGKDIANIDGYFGFPFVSCLPAGTQQRGVSLYPRETVSELSVNVAGKNLSSGVFTTATSNGITFERISDTETKITGTATAEYPQRSTTAFKIPKGEYTISANVSGASNNDVYVLVYCKGTTGGAIAGTKTNPYSQFTISEDNDIYITVVAQGKNKVFNATISWQLELGSTATEYEPPQVTAIPVDLQGNTLNAGDSVSITNGKAILSTGSKQIDLGSFELPSLLTDTTNIWSNVDFDAYVPTAITQPKGYLTGFIAGAYSFSNVVDFVNDGDVETYLRVVIIANGAVTNPSIIKDDKYVKILDTLKQDDVVEIDFTQRPPSVTKNGENIINLSDRKSSFTGMQLDVGINQISYGADDGENNMSVSIYFEKRYLGI